MSNQSSKTALLVGATGLVGNELLKNLQHDPEYHKIIAITRRPLGLAHDNKSILDKIDNHVIPDFSSLKDFDITEDISEIFCTLGTTIKDAGSKEAFKLVDYEYPRQLIELAQKAKIPQYVIVTALGSNEKSLFFYNKTKGQIENELKQSGIPSVHILRPSLILGNRKKTRLGERIGELAYPILNILCLGLLSPYKPIHAVSIAKAMHHFAKEKRQGVHIHPSSEIAETADLLNK